MWWRRSRGATTCSPGCSASSRCCKRWRTNNALVAARTPMERLATDFVVLLRYLGLLVFPRQLTWDYSYNQIPIVGWSNAAALISLALYVALGVFAVIALRRRSAYGFGI